VTIVALITSFFVGGQELRKITVGKHLDIEELVSPSQEEVVLGTKRTQLFFGSSAESVGETDLLRHPELTVRTESLRAGRVRPLTRSPPVKLSRYEKSFDIFRTIPAFFL